MQVVFTVVMVEIQLLQSWFWMPRFFLLKYKVCWITLKIKALWYLNSPTPSPIFPAFFFPLFLAATSDVLEWPPAPPIF